MTPGANIPLPVPQVVVEVTAPRALDVSGLLVTAGGKVRSDADFVFFNQPHGPGVTHRPAAPGVPDAITVQTSAVPPDIEKVVVTASLDSPGATFAGAEPTATVRNAADGTVLATFTPPRLSSETALVVAEVYRRQGTWKLRAVGQGYANGLAGIATDFGVTVDEAPQAPPAGPQAPAAPMPQAPMPQAPMPQAPVPAPGGGFAPPPAAPPPAAPPPMPQAPWAPAPPPPSPPQAPGQPAPGAPSGVVNLDKGRVSLVKDQTVSLVKGGRPMLSVVRMGLGWEPAYRGRSIDLDASVIAYDARRKKVDTVWFMKLSALGGALQHSGDNLTGEGAGDDEVITVDLGRIPPEVSGLVFVVNSFSGQKFNQVAKAYCRLLDGHDNSELVRFDLTNSEARTGVIMCKLIRQYSGEWQMTAVGQYVDAKTARGMVKPGAAVL
ncbi:TerD family protein [Wenjunlia vitaminophila]|uniref:TerD family protein n=1 Tax=Wenjunlia vitaminophila TaxID=76728 RepID=UPI000CEC4281|nr:TerD family protein [Wenjunlia vitaminophila]